MKERIGSFFVRKGLVSEAQLSSALIHQKRLGGRLGPIFVSLRYLSPRQLLDGLSEYFQCPSVDLRTDSVDARAVELVKPEIARGHGVLPIRERRDDHGKKVLLVAMRQPDDLALLDQLAFMTDRVIQPVVVMDKALDDAIDYFFDDPQAASFARFDGRDRLLGFEEASPESLEHLYTGVDGSDSPREADSLAFFTDADGIEIDLSDAVDARTYLKFLIRLLLRKGVLTADDVRDLMRSY